MQVSLSRQLKETIAEFEPSEALAIDAYRLYRSYCSSTGGGFTPMVTKGILGMLALCSSVPGIKDTS